jgi:putative transposase
MWVQGLFFYLYLPLDLYSRKIVGWEVYDRESGEHAEEVVQKAVWPEKCT